MIEDIQQDIDVAVTLKQFTSFLASVRRSSKCPVCPHDGAWNFYIDRSGGANNQSPMAISKMVTSYANAPDDTYPVFSMECPNCAYMIYTNANSVAKKIKAQENPDE